jgi:hypothetical protein
VTSRESEWSPEEQAWMLALAYWRAGLCHRCHGELAETTSPQHDADNPHGTHVYKRVALQRCHRCTASIVSERQHAEALAKFKGSAPAEAVIHHVALVQRGR